MPEKTLTCFVASAIGREDVDEILDEAIAPVLNDREFDVKRVDRVEHNDDIDDKIFELIEAADFCIADLTYARPSVYYEAGYAIGLGKPVIYTARSDHLRAKDDDPHGLFRVHFDLQMKNIIPWTAPNITFKRKLNGRVGFVTRPLLAEIRRQENVIEQENQFLSWSQSEQIKQMANVVRRRILACGYAIQRDEVEDRGFARRFIAEKAVDEVTTEVIVLCEPSLVKKIFTSVEFVLPFLDLGWSETGFRRHLVFCGLNRVRSTSLPGYFSSFAPVTSHVFKYEFRVEEPSRTAEMYVHVLDAVKSLEGFEIKFDEALAVALLSSNSDRR